MEKFFFSGLTVKCLKCRRNITMGYYDPKGKVFEAYYCFPCGMKKQYPTRKGNHDELLNP